MDVSEALIYCYDEPDMVHIVLQKVTKFLINYCNEYKKVGANGIVMAEPLAGLLSPDLAQEFSADYVKQIVDAVQDDNFLVVYHNCGNTAVKTIDTIVTNGCLMYHFGNAINMAEMMSHVPENLIAMGNVDPAGEFRNGTMLRAYHLMKIMGPGTVLYGVIKVGSDCGSIIFGNLPLIFAMGVSIGMAKAEKAVASVISSNTS